MSAYARAEPDRLQGGPLYDSTNDNLSERLKSFFGSYAGPVGYDDDRPFYQYISDGFGQTKDTLYYIDEGYKVVSGNIHGKSWDGEDQVAVAIDDHHRLLAVGLSTSPKCKSSSRDKCVPERPIRQYVFTRNSGSGHGADPSVLQEWRETVRLDFQYTLQSYLRPEEYYGGGYQSVEYDQTYVPASQRVYDYQPNKYPFPLDELINIELK